MASFEIEGKIEIDISGLEEMASEIRTVSISTLQGEIRRKADQILRELAQQDWPAGRVSPGYVSTGQLADAVMVTGNGNNLLIYMDGTRMSMVAPDLSGSSSFGEPHQWGVHMGVMGQAYNVKMPELLNFGGGGLRPHEGSGYFEKAFGIYETEFIHILGDALRAAGFEVTEG